jgi:hypothetical protein
VLSCTYQELIISAAFGILLVNGTETPEWKYVL